MGDDSEGDDVQLFKRQRSTSPLSESPLAALTENQQQEGNDNAAGADTVSSSDGETDEDAKKKARVAAYWSKRQAKKSAEEAVWAATIYPVVIVRDPIHTHDKTITYSGNPNSVVELYPYSRNVAGAKCFMGNIAVHRRYLKEKVKVLIIPGQICKLFGNEDLWFCISSIIMSTQGSSR